MANKVTVREANDGALWIIATAKPDGSEQVSPIDAVHALDHAHLVKTLTSMAKQDTTMRAARQTLLGEIFKSPKIQDFRGKSDPKSNSIGKVLKDLINEAQTDYFRHLEAKGELKSVLPAKSDNVQKDFNTFVSAIIEDSNYKNIKSYVSRYFAFCGLDCVTKSGMLVPQPVMSERIKAMMDIPAPDNSIAGQLRKVLELIKDDKYNFKDADSRNALPIVVELSKRIADAVSYYDEVATAAAQAMPPNVGNTVAVATEALGKMRRAPAPAKEDALV